MTRHPFVCLAVTAATAGASARSRSRIQHDLLRILREVTHHSLIEQILLNGLYGAELCSLLSSERTLL